MRCTAGLVVVAALVAGRPAAAERAGVVVVARPRAPATADDTARALAGALAIADPLTARDALAAARLARAGGAVPSARLRAFARVTQLTGEGWRAYLAVDGEFAAARLAAARAEAEELLTLDGGPEVYADVALRLGVVLTAHGRAAEGASVLRLAHALDPARSPSAAEFSPDALAAYAAAVAATPARRQVELLAPAGATIAIDGGAALAAPVVAELSVGQHVLVARAPGKVARGLAVSIAADGAARVELALEPDTGAVLDGAAGLVGDPTLDGALVEQVRLYAELDAVYLVASVEAVGGPAVLGQRCAGGRPACSEVLEVGYVDGGLDGAARTLAGRLATARLRGAATLAADPRLGARRRSEGGGRRRWIYAGVGVAAVAAVVTAIVLATGDDPLPTVTLDPGEF